MDKLIYVLPVLACPAMMAAMMWFMARSGRRGDAHSADDGQAKELHQLRAEVERLRADDRESSVADGGPTAR